MDLVMTSLAGLTLLFITIHYFSWRKTEMKDYTTNNANLALPPQWNDCTTCGAGITRKTDPSQQCRNCYEAQVMQELRRSSMDVSQINELNGNSDRASGTWGFGDADCELTGGMG